MAWLEQGKAQRKCRPPLEGMQASHLSDQAVLARFGISDAEDLKSWSARASRRPASDIHALGVGESLDRISCWDGMSDSEWSDS